MNAFHIKLLAVVTMVIDHVGLFFFPQETLFRLIGRVSFPLFAWLIANGAHHTHNMRAYTIRIFLFAFVSQVPYMFANYQLNPTHFNLNTLFTLGLGLSAIMFIQKTKNRYMWVLIIALFCAIAHVIIADYGIFGVLSIVCFYLFYHSFRYLVLSQVLLFLTFAVFLSKDWTGLSELFGLVSLVFLWAYNKKEGPKVKYVFYLFYPLQYLLIFLVERFL